ncbi:hypothetical protein H4Q26_015883 [Puccinia striiformis f. sp. tritici PST-130]|nr:hypothetical protein H4Q26_015883 [Puccinia striiformis f. sp. tritici PST-130]
MANHRALGVKNRATAPVQITAKQLLHKAQERQETIHSAPHQKRKEFEEVIRQTRQDVSIYFPLFWESPDNPVLQAWTKLATWEASQNEFARACSVFKRALDLAPTTEKLWLTYCEMILDPFWIYITIEYVPMTLSIFTTNIMNNPSQDISEKTVVPFTSGGIESTV